MLPTITHIHMSVIPLLAAAGTIFLDERSHKTIYDGCQVARSRGAAVRRFRFEDPEHLEELLDTEPDPTRLVCMDGVNSMTGNAPDLPAFARGGTPVRGSALRGRRAWLRRDRRARGRRALSLRQPRQLDCTIPATSARATTTASSSADLEGLLVAACLHRVPHQDKELLEVTSLPLLGSIAHRVPGHRAGGIRRKTSVAVTSCAASLPTTRSGCWSSTRTSASTPQYVRTADFSIPITRTTTSGAFLTSTCSQSPQIVVFFAGLRRS